MTRKKNKYRTENRIIKGKHSHTIFCKTVNDSGFPFQKEKVGADKQINKRRMHIIELIIKNIEPENEKSVSWT